MAGEICFFLFVRGSDGSVAVTVHKSAGDVFERWENVASEGSVPSALLFAGETSPPVSEIASLLDKRPNCVLLAASSVWLLPSRNAIAGQAIGVIGPSETHAEMPVFVAANGWGYDLEDTGGNGPSSTALSHLDIRGSLDHASFLKIVPMVDPGNPFEIARIAPASAVSVPLWRLPLTTRCANVIRSQAIEAVGDLAKFTVEQARRWPSFGRKSISDLAGSLLAFLKMGPATVLDSPESLPSASPPPASEPPAPASEPPAPASEPPVLDTLRSEFEELVARLPERRGVVIKGRLAYSGEKRTLEDIAQELSLTRERVRQIEEATLARWIANAWWIEKLQSKIEKLRTKRTAPLYLDLIAAEDRWFDGFDDNLRCLIELVTRLGGDAVKLCWFHGRPIVCGLDTAGWEALRARVLAYFKIRRGTGMNRPEADRVIDGFLRTEGCPELAGELWKELAEYLQFGVAPGSDVEQLIEVGRRFPNQLRAILEQSDEPLHYTELHRRYERDSGNTAAVGYVHASIARSGALYYGRGRYGSWRHCPVPLSRREDIVTEIEQIAYEQSARQWHVTELLGILQERRPDLSDLLDKYLLNLLLAESNRLRSVGRLVWSAREGGGSPANRIEIAKECLSILIRNGAPMSKAALKEALMRIRGAGEFFYIAPTERMARIAPSLWGLIERDFCLDREERDAAVRIVFDFLERTRMGVHISEVRGVVAERMKLPPGVTAYMLVSLCQSHPVLNVYRGQYIGLKSWGEPRRATVSDVVNGGHGFFSQPRSIGEIASFVSILAGRPVTTEETTGVLTLHGFQFNRAEKLWMPPWPEDLHETEVRVSEPRT